MNSTIHRKNKGFNGEKWIGLTPENVQRRHDESYCSKQETKCLDQLADGSSTDISASFTY
jgi:hypothetical protein